MNLVKRELRLFLMLLGFWIILAGDVTPRQLITGVMSCGLTIGIYNWILSHSGADRVRWIPFRMVLHFGTVLLTEIAMSALAHLRRIVEGHKTTAVCRLVLTVEEELTVTLIANAITLTPGTVTVEADRRMLTVLFYSDYPNQCPLDLVLMTERLQNPFLTKEGLRREVNHA